MKNTIEIAIIGGTGGMGQLLAKELKKFANITIISRSLEKAQKVSKKFGVQAGLLKDCDSADIIIVSVPIENTLETCEKLLNIIKPNALLMDISAVKQHLEKIKENLPKSISYISIHPLFGPEGSFKNSNILLIPLQDQNWEAKITEIFKNLGSIITKTTAEEHDLMMSKIQVAHHLIYLLLASYLSDSKISQNFFTRSLRKTLENFKGIERNLSAILEIQLKNPHATPTREAMSVLLEDLINLDAEKIKTLQSRIARFKNNYLFQ